MEGRATTMEQHRRPVGELLRRWRGRRRLSQLELALESGISARHLSFVENGKSAPSRETILRLAQQLDLPLRERNHLLLAAGYAPVYSEATLGSPRCPPCAGRCDRCLAGTSPRPP